MRNIATTIDLMSCNYTNKPTSKHNKKNKMNATSTYNHS